MLIMLSSENPCGPIIKVRKNVKYLTEGDTLIWEKAREWDNGLNEKLGIYGLEN